MRKLLLITILLTSCYTETPILSADNNTCNSPSMLFSGQTVKENLSEFSNDYEGYCGGIGKDAVYYFDLDETSTVFIGVMSSEFDPVAYLSAECGKDNQCNDNAFPGIKASVLNVELESGRYYIIVDSKSDTYGMFQLEFYANAITTEGDSCGFPKRLEHLARGNTSALQDLYDPDCQLNDSTDEVFYFIVENEIDMRVDTCTGASWDTVLYYRDNCEHGVDLQCDDNFCGNSRPTSAVRQRFIPGIYFLFVDGFNGDSGDYTLSVTVF